ncbi:MAG: phage Gp37/Gp68 family protein [Spirochaetes bacterium]|nr:phage Gp37/Gp68 family protein [Spirochaetota bacterium]
MSSKSKIEWTDATWNPVTGCTKVSPGCDNCYAEREVETRFSKNPKSKWYGRHFNDIQCHPDKLEEPLRMKKSKRIFVCPRADLFHDSVSEEFIDRVFAVMALCPQHIFQILTKRSERMYEYLNSGARAELVGIEAESISGIDRHTPALKQRWPFPLPNVWLGVTAENQAMADKRIPIILQIPAAVRFISAEPIVGPIDLSEWLCPGHGCEDYGLCKGKYHSQCLLNSYPHNGFIDWVICGGESGPDARPAQPDWILTLKYQCAESKTPFFFKQWGEFIPVIKNFEVTMNRVGKKKAGRLLYGKEYNEYPRKIKNEIVLKNNT